MHAACKEAQKTLPAYYIPLLKNLEHLLSQNIFPTSDSKEPANLFMCLTAPLAAKAGEDTAFYRYARLLSRNEVGTDLELFSKDIETFHQTNMERFASYPDALLCTATHDHKRGEDGRARLMVLSEPEVNWPDTAMHWCEKNDTLCTDGNSISRMDELFIYQTLIAAWPLDRSDFSHLPQRLKGYLTKALREASLRTSWNAPDRVYEETCQSFMMQLLHTPFVQEFTAFIGRISPAAALNSLAQLILRYTVPGVPDLYQGRENWDFSLVDPDNRRPVNYPKLQESLDEKANLFILAHSWQDGRIKQALISKLLALRKNHPQIFTNGYYEPVSIQGPLADHVVAFQRITKDIKIFVIVTRFPFSLSINNYLQSHHEGWMKTQISLPASQLNRAWESVLWERPLENIAPFCLAYFYGSIPFDVLIAHNTDGVS
ncbi:hypothetical protein AZ09_00075 [Acetobacter aceti 1023]|nr:hypothetical protein AZ09_00075 [Acetobacter aceti 1023]